MALDRHPEAERLAEYADGVLPVAHRVEIERHLAECADCRSVVADTMNSLQPESLASTGAPSAERVSLFRSPRSIVALAAALAAAAAIVLTVRVVRPEWVFGLRGSPPELQELIAAVAKEPTRPVEGRLSGGFKYGPPPSIKRGDSQSELAPDIRIAAARIEKLTAADAENKVRLGLAYIATGQLEKAVDVLQDVVTERPENAEAYNDLSAAYLARAVRQGRTEDAPKALAAAERAIKADPGATEAWFNRALALETLSLIGESAAAWREYLERDPNSEWATEARSHLERKRQGLRVDPSAVQRLVDAGTLTVDAARIVARDQSQAVREYLEGPALLAWAAAIREDRLSQARQLVGTASLLADALAARTGDLLARDTLEILSRASTSEQKSLASGHQMFADGMGLYRQFRLDDSAPLFSRAAVILSARHSPFAFRVRLQAAIVNYARRDIALASRQLSELKKAIDSRDYRTLNGQTGWMIGLSNVDSGNFESALENYRNAASEFERAGEFENVASVSSLTAEVLRAVGRLDEAWKYQTAALIHVDGMSKARARESVLLVASLMAREQQSLEASLHFENAALAVAVDDSPASQVQVLLRRAATLRRLGQFDKTKSDLDAIDSGLTKVSDRSIHDRLSAEAAVLRAEMSLRENPQYAIAQATAAIDYVSRATIVELLPELFLTRGKALAIAAEPVLAEADFRRGIDVFEKHRRAIRETATRISYFDEAWSLVDELVKLKMNRGEGVQALTAAEDGRARVLFETEAPARWADDWWRSLPASIAELEYVLLDDRLVTWLVTKDGVQHFEQKVSRSLVSKLSARMTVEVVRGERNPIAASQLYDLLIRPFASRIPPSSALAIVGDLYLNQIPFAALYDRSTSRFLIERHSVMFAPSLRALRASVTMRPPRERLHNPLIVGVDSGDTALPTLREVPAELHRLSELFNDATILTGSAATKAQFSAQSKDRGLIHFAGHAIVSADPSLSRLVFAPSHEGRELYPRAIEALQLADTNLVVLAACDTASGPYSRSEGVLSLAKPFLKAGVPSIVATLWPVDDHAAGRLVTTFYRALLSGRDAAAALQAAQIATIRDSRSQERWDMTWAAWVLVTVVE